MSSTDTAWMTPQTHVGCQLPTQSSSGGTGVVSNPSNVPRSRSREIVSALNMTKLMVRITPMSPDTMNGCVRSARVIQAIDLERRRRGVVLHRPDTERTTPLDHQFGLRRKHRIRGIEMDDDGMGIQIDDHQRRSALQGRDGRRARLGAADVHGSFMGSEEPLHAPEALGIGGDDLDLESVRREFDCATEQSDLQDRDPKEHAERGPITQQLARFLEHQGGESGQCAPGETHAIIPRTPAPADRAQPSTRLWTRPSRK